MAVIRRVIGLLFCAWMAMPAQAVDSYTQGKAAFDAHQFAAAASLFERAEAENPGQSDALLYAGKALSNLNRFPDAEQVLRQYTIQHPDSSDALYMLGFVLNREGRAKESLEIYTRAAQLHIPNSDDLKVVALDYVLLEDYSDAVRWLKEALQFNPMNQQAWYWLGRCYYAEGSFGQAQQAFTRALALDAKDTKAATNLGLTLDMLNQPDAADLAYRHAIALADEDSHTDQWPYLDYGAFLLEQGRAADAIPLLRKSIVHAPGCAQCYGKLGRALDETGNSKEACTNLERAVELSPNDPALHYALGRAYRSAGLLEKARHELELSARLYGTKNAADSK